MKYHSVVYKIIDLLKKEDVWFETFEHKSVKTSEEAAKVRKGYSLAQGSKALISRVKLKKGKGKRFVMIVVPGNLKFDSKKVRKILDAKDITLASIESVAKITNGVKIGGIPPFGNLFNLETIADKGILEHEKIIFNAGDRKFSISMKTKDYLKIVKPRLEHISR